MYLFTEPVLSPFRNLFNSFGLLGSGIDFSPMVAIFALNYIRNFIIFYSHDGLFSNITKLLKALAREVARTGPINF